MNELAMTTDDFLLRHWKYYIQIEKEFVQTESFVTIDQLNFQTYSDAYMKLLLQIGSEVDITCKLLCDLLGEKIKDGSISKYRKCITSGIVDFCEVRIAEKQSHLNSCPWEEWAYENRVPTWWTVYNKVKHHRVSSGNIAGITQEYYKFANQKYTLLAMMALYQVMMFSYYHLAKAAKERVTVPLPASRLFETSSSVWKEIDLGADSLFYVSEESGHLIMVTGPFAY